jgi:hypothetical protein
MLPIVLIVAQEIDPEKARPGGVAGLFFLGLLGASVLLFRSMNRHLRVARENLAPPITPVQETAEGDAGAGMDVGRGSGTASSEPDGDDAARA